MGAQEMTVKTAREFDVGARRGIWRGVEHALRHAYELDSRVFVQSPRAVGELRGSTVAAAREEGGLDGLTLAQRAAQGRRVLMVMRSVCPYHEALAIECQLGSQRGLHDALALHLRQECACQGSQAWVTDVVAVWSAGRARKRDARWASLLGVSVRTLRAWRNGGRTHHGLVPTLDAWLESGVRRLEPVFVARGWIDG